MIEAVIPCAKDSAFQFAQRELQYFGAFIAFPYKHLMLLYNPKVPMSEDDEARYLLF